LYLSFIISASESFIIFHFVPVVLFIWKVISPYKNTGYLFCQALPKVETCRIDFSAGFCYNEKMTSMDTKLVSEIQKRCCKYQATLHHTLKKGSYDQHATVGCANSRLYWWIATA